MLIYYTIKVSAEQISFFVKCYAIAKQLTRKYRTETGTNLQNSEELPLHLADNRALQYI